MAVRRDASIDLGDGFDRLHFQAGGSIGGSLAMKGTNDVQTTTPGLGAALLVDRNFSLDVKGETEDTVFDASGGLFVDRSFTVIGGPGDEAIHTQEGKVGRSVKLDFGDGSGRRPGSPGRAVARQAGVRRAMAPGHRPPCQAPEIANRFAGSARRLRD